MTKKSIRLHIALAIFSVVLSLLRNLSVSLFRISSLSSSICNKEWEIPQLASQIATMYHPYARQPLLCLQLWPYGNSSRPLNS